MKSRYTTFGDRDLQSRIRKEIKQYSDSIYDAVEKDCTYQAIAVTMAALHREFGFGKDRLQRLKAAIESEYTLMLGGVMGTEYSPRDCQKWLKEQYDIDLEVSRYDAK